MLIVRDLQGNTEALTNIQGAEVNEEVNGDFSISFTSFLSPENQHAYPLLQEESIVELEGHEFRVKQLAEVRNRKDVQAQHIFFDLIEHQVYSYIGGTKSVDEVFSFILDGTEWTFENVDVSTMVVTSNFGESNALKLIRDTCIAFDCEIQIMPGKHLKIMNRIGETTDNQFRYGYNVKTLKKTVDTTNLYTVIKGFGADGLEVTYTSPNADIYGERHAEPIKDDRYSVADSMIDRLKQELNDAPEISIEIEVSQLDFNVNLGDKLWTIYEPLNMELQTRISVIKSYPFTKKSPVVTIENRKKTFTDILTQQRIEIDQNKKETKSRFDQTNERITLEVERVDESIATLEVTADEIRSTVTTEVERLDGAIESSNSLISQTAGEIRSEVSTEVTRIDGEIESTNSVITQQAGLISSKVTSGEVSSIISQWYNNVTIEAEKINLLGITQVARTVRIGEFGDQEEHSLVFDSSSSIYTVADGLRIESMGDISFSTSNIDFSRVWNVTGLYARFG